ncbi:MAG: pilus assembly protein N-terminal domain-containing protein [Bryobacterales bacterium]|jgi:pilus assembly protein CpaC|nr:pilus assembly protein N-terminal domain-containing protein [Bryobacterales bacterium]
MKRQIANPFRRTGRGTPWWGAAGRVAAAAVLGAAALLAQSATQDLRLTVGKSIVIDYPSDVGRISTSNPDVVDAVPITAREILLNAKTVGNSTVVVWAKTGERSFFALNVEHNTEPIQRLLQETFPNEAIQVALARDSASLNGQVTSAAVAEKATALVAPLVKSVVNNLVVAPPGIEKQILLRVKFAELNRSRADELGVNILSTGAANTPGQVTTGQFPSARATRVEGVIGAPVRGTTSDFSISDSLNLFAFRPDLNLAAFLRALTTRNVLQILAEPNLVATNGKEASFLAGGEFPIPVLQGGANAGAVTIQFREYGIRLTFTPETTAHNTIKMRVRSELSTIDLANSITFAGFTIPALSTRRAETDVELGAGQSFVVAGLLDDRVTETLSRIPGLAEIPVLGALFRSRATNKTKTELVVLVTPEITEPLNASDRKPADEMYRPGLPAGLGDVIRHQEEHEKSMQVDPKTKPKM